MIINGRELIEILPLADLYTEHKDHHRLTVFVNKGRECVKCNREGVLLLVTRDLKGHRGVHVDLYTNDFVLMTVDHIIPKGRRLEMGYTKEEIESLDNKQPMCGPCNWTKRNTIQEAPKVKIVRRQIIRPQVLTKLVNNPNVFNKDLSKVTI